MRVLVIQEQHFMQLPNGEVWVDKQSDRKFWDRYLEVFDEIVVCARMQKSEQLGEKALRSDRAEVMFVGMPDFKGVKGIVRYYFQIYKSLKSALELADCVILRAPSPISMITYGAVKRSGKPFAVELMNNPATHYSTRSMHNVFQPLIAAFITNQTKRMCKSANGVSYVTEQVLQKLYPPRASIETGNSKYFTAHYSTIRLCTADYKKKKWFSVRPEPVVLVHSGEMADYRKGQNIFIETLALLKEQGYAVRGILIGDGVLRAEFQYLAKGKNIYDCVEFVGWKSGYEQVQKELHRGHIFVFPSTGEGLPRSVIEAMANGLLCIGSNIDGVSELLENNCLVNKFEGKAFAERIKLFLDDWSKTIISRDVQFERSFKYENSILQNRRYNFYSKLKQIVINSKQAEKKC